MSDEQTIDPAPSLRPWRIELPNIYDDAGLSPHEFRLLVHYVRRGSCHETVRTTAAVTGMSAAMVVNTRNSLVKKGYIVVTEQEEFRTLLITVVDKWEENFEKYSKRSQSEQTRSPREQRRSPREPKKLTLNKKEPIKKKRKDGADGPPPPKPAKKRDERLDLPAIAAYRELVQLNPPKAIRDQFADVLDIDKWREVITAWVGKGYRPQNITGMLDWYRGGIPARANGSAPPTRTIADVIHDRQRSTNEPR